MERDTSEPTNNQNGQGRPLRFLTTGGTPLIMNIHDDDESRADGVQIGGDPQPKNPPTNVQSNTSPVQPQPDERITQAEYEKVVKGARLTDPVEEPISRSCTECINSVCLQNDKPLFACDFHIHSVDDNNKQNKHNGCN